MVQIKHVKEHVDRLPLLFYIPYGSDKTEPSSMICPSATPFYIPYGSDKTPSPEFDLIKKKPFISHMVQIKQMVLFSVEPSSFVLYPIWFR